MEVMYSSPYRYFITSMFPKEMVIAKKIVFEIIADYDCITLKT